MGFAPIGRILGDGMNVARRINAEYGERPNQGSITSQGAAYTKANFPKLDYITTTTML
jgi:hypothetical protein